MIRSLDSFLDSRLVSRSQRLRRLTAELWEQLPPDLHGHCVVVGCDDEILSVLTDNSAWATRLRFMEPQLIAHFRNATPACTRLKIVVRPAIEDPHTTRARTERAPLSASVKRGLDALADEIDDESLRAALKRLSRRGVKSQE